MAFLIIVLSYASMFYNIQRTGTQTTKYSNHIKKEVTIAKRFFSIVITDSLCWIPIFILKILSLLHVEIPGGCKCSITCQSASMGFISHIHLGRSPQITFRTFRTERRGLLKKLS